MGTSYINDKVSFSKHILSNSVETVGRRFESCPRLHYGGVAQLVEKNVLT